MTLRDLWGPLVHFVQAGIVPGHSEASPVWSPTEALRLPARIWVLLRVFLQVSLYT